MFLVPGSGVATWPMSGTALLTVRIAGTTVGLICVEVPTRLPPCRVPDIPVAGRTVGSDAVVLRRLPTCGLLDVVSKVNIDDGAITAVAAIAVVFFGSAITSGLCKIVAAPGLFVLQISMRAFARNGAMVAMTFFSVFTV